MKIIVSTETFAKEIRNAIDSRMKEFEITLRENCSGEIRFSNDTDARFVSIYPAKALKPHTYKGWFNPVTWYRLLTFLKTLEEQPIVIEFKEYANTEVHGEPEIELSQFIKRF